MGRRCCPSSPSPPQMPSLGSFVPQSLAWLGESHLSISAPSLEPFMAAANRGIFIANSLKTHKEKSNSRLAYEGSFYKCAAIRVYTKQLLSSKTLHLISLLICPGWLLQSLSGFLSPCAATHKRPAAPHQQTCWATPGRDAFRVWLCMTPSALCLSRRPHQATGPPLAKGALDWAGWWP